MQCESPRTSIHPSPLKYRHDVYRVLHSHIRRIGHLILSAHTKLDIVLAARLDVWVVPGNADSEGSDHHEAIIDVQGPLVLKKVCLLRRN
jgi:hypothetical protein